MRIHAALILALALTVGNAASGSAQTRLPPKDDAPTVSFRPFFLATGEKFSASTTFKSVFGQDSLQPFWGAGLELALKNGLFVDVQASRFRKNGQQAFLFNGQVFPLGIPLTATVTPLEFIGGYRFRHVSRRVVPFAGIGVGSYAYTETSGFADSSENVDARHAGLVLLGGAEVRVHRYVGVSGDVAYRHVPGILGLGGISKDANENDLGGMSIELKVLVGR
jgi:hypothetical protein